jgi:hypothetical protein
MRFLSQRKIDGVPSISNKRLLVYYSRVYSMSGSLASVKGKRKQNGRLRR